MLGMKQADAGRLYNLRPETRNLRDAPRQGHARIGGLSDAPAPCGKGGGACENPRFERCSAAGQRFFRGLSLPASQSMALRISPSSPAVLVKSSFSMSPRAPPGQWILSTHPVASGAEM